MAENIAAYVVIVGVIRLWSKHGNIQEALTPSWHAAKGLSIWELSGMIAVFIATFTVMQAVRIQRRYPSALPEASSQELPSARRPWKDIAVARYGILWVRTSNGYTHLRCPDHSAVKLLFRQTSGSWGPQVRDLLLSDYPERSDGRSGSGSLYCTETPHLLPFDSDKTLNEAYLEMDNLLDARVRERAEKREAEGGV